MTFTVPELVAGQRYYFAVQAYSTSGLFSAYSAEVTALVPEAPVQSPVLTTVAPGNGSFKGGTAVTLTGTSSAPGRRSPSAALSRAR